MTFLGNLAAFADRKLLMPAVYPSRGGAHPERAPRVFPPTPSFAVDPFAAPELPTFERSGDLVRFESPAWPLIDDVQDELLARAENRVVPLHVRGPVRQRAVVLAAHGYLGGNPAVDRLGLAASRFEHAGYTFCHATLPFHGRRKPAGVRPFFPHPDPRITFEALRQGALDLAAAVRVLRALGARRVVLAGLSLGGYVAALTATIADDLDGLVLLTPLASFRDLDAAPAHDARDLLTATRAGVRTAKLPGSGVLVVGAREDRIVPPAHARSLADSFKGELALVEGAHLLPFGRDAVVDRWLASR